MRRREFLKTMLVAGATSSIASFLPRAAGGLSTPYGGPLLIMVHAYGGWDPVQFCDPKGDLNRGFSKEEVESVGGIRYAPVAWVDESAGVSRYYAEDLFTSLHGRTVMVQGINMQTNVHQVGTRYAFQGSMATGFPTLSAAFCAVHAPSLLLSYLTISEHHSTGGLLPYTPMARGELIRSIASPNETTNLSNGIEPYRMPQDVFAIIEESRRKRYAAFMSDPTLLPKRRIAFNSYFRAANGSADLERLGDIIPADGFQNLDENGVENELAEKSDAVLHSMAAGLSAAADIQFPGIGYFDSHANHVAQQANWLAKLSYGIRFLWRRAEEIDARVGSNIADRLTVVIHSEFGRTPHFNADAGTDHWPTTSAIIMRKDFETNGIGSRTVGWSTNDGRYMPGRINPITLERDENGIELTSAHLHKALREYLGIADSPVLAGFGFPDIDSVNMFTPGLATTQG